MKNWTKFQGEREWKHLPLGDDMVTRLFFAQRNKGMETSNGRTAGEQVTGVICSSTVCPAATGAK